MARVRFVDSSTTLYCEGRLATEDGISTTNHNALTRLLSWESSVIEKAGSAPSGADPVWGKLNTVGQPLSYRLGVRFSSADLAACGTIEGS